MIAGTTFELGKVNTEGCGCCSVDLYIVSDREKIIKELEKNIITAIDVCKIINYSFSDLLNDVLKKQEN